MSLIILYLLVVFMNAANLFFQVYFTVMYSDLESDFINPVDLCNRLNFFILPEAGIQAAVALLLLLSGQWLSFIFNLPILFFNAKKYINKTHLLDATEIFRTLGRHKNESFVKLGIHLLLFFYYLYCLIMAIVADDTSSA
ncbi:uncharacterized protein SAPINGB_P005780 [Magnusiomyces paraingens]|uniref:ER-derived vesicles protein ERV14 n=1 Tax=Magnusiomyces paraingens TaxID=2606893 RepID=A0A5E8C6V5_9ASCO|nr:uncharacterized protein SAPINGB_P005780 [Saprochaete ingens]VVT57608.1 unnamed protein product [Saprochaete ingens]